MIRQKFDRSLIILVASSLCACTTLQVMTPTSGATPAERQEFAQVVKVGDRVDATDTRGKLMTIAVTAVSPQGLEGTEIDSGAVVKLPTSEIGKIEVRKVSVWRTAALTIGLLGVAILAALVKAEEKLLGNCC